MQTSPKTPRPLGPATHTDDQIRELARAAGRAKRSRMVPSPSIDDIRAEAKLRYLQGIEHDFGDLCWPPAHWA